MSSYLISVLTLVGINVILALGLNLITGFCGQISLGHAAFYGVGAYTVAIIAKDGAPIWLALLSAMATAGGAGLLVGLCSLRVREDFLAIATMAANFIFIGVIKQNEFLGGEVGISGISNPLTAQNFALLVVLLGIIVVVFCVHVRRSWLGFAFSAVAADDQAAQLICVDSRAFKLAAFCAGTALAGLSGGLLAYYLGGVSPEAFGFVTSISVLSMVVLGGMGSVGGCVASTALLTILPDVLRFAENYRLLIFGLLLFVVMRFAPGGIGAVPASFGIGRKA